MGILNTRHIFGVRAAAPAFFNLGSIVGGLGCAAWLAPGYLSGVLGRGPAPAPGLVTRAMTGMAIGTLAGGLLQLLVQVPSLWRVGFRYRPLLALRAPGLRLVASFCLPAAAGLALMGVPVIGLIYEHGRFASRDTAAAAQALAGYALGLAGYAGIKVLAPAFYALGDARTPMRVSVLSMATNYALNWLFVRRLGFGHVGLALATSAVALGNFGLLFVVLRRRVGGFGQAAAAARIAPASAGLGRVAG